MRSLEFVQIDVFTDQRFAGNQLAVFLDGSSLSTFEMQMIAREMNFSESSFVLPPSSADCDAQLRIFTPTREMPMAGHPVIGTALVLFEQKKLRVGLNIIDLAVGPFEVWVEKGDATDPVIWMNQGKAVFGTVWSDRERIANVLGLEACDLLEDMPIQVVSTGVPFMIVPIRDLDSLKKARCDQGALRSVVASAENVYFYLFASTSKGFRARMFDPTPNEMPEDPATGSAAGSLAAYVNHYQLSSVTDLIIDQGIEMGRPSLIQARVRRIDSAQSVMIGGTGRVVGEGRIFLE